MDPTHTGSMEKGDSVMNSEPYPSISPNTDTDDIKEATAHAQPGVQNIEAVTQTWTKGALVFAYAMIWLIYFTEGILSGVSGALLPFVTSAFALHSLTPTVAILSSVIGGVTNLTIAKVLDIFGRPQGYLFCVVLGTLGLVMMAACKNVEAYAAAQVFYTVGNNGVQYALSVFIADTSSLRNRGLMQAFLSSPNVITCWLAGPIASAFLKGPGWQWCFGSFSIIIPVVTSPLFILLIFNTAKARKTDHIPTQKTDRTAWESFICYSREFDAVGLVLLSAGVALFLLPFNLAPLQTKGWSSPLIISLLVVGFALIVVFTLWESFYATTTLLPYALLTDRTVVGACILSATLFLSYYCWAAYFSSFLQVVNNLSVTEASYVIQTYTVGSCLCALAVGLLIRFTGRFKPVCLYLGIPLSVLGLGLMIKFRQPNAGIGYIVMCEIFISIAAGVVIICDEIAIMAAASHQYIAIVIAVLGLFGNIGGAIGLTISAAIWQHVFPQKLADYLPSSELSNLLNIYESLDVQLSYPIGSATRIAIQHAYGDAQRMLLIAGSSAWIFGLIAVLMWRNIDVTNIRQVKGQVV